MSLVRNRALGWLIALLVGLPGMTGIAAAQFTCTANAGNLNWSAAATWASCGGGVPGADDIAVKNSAGTLTVNAVVNVGELRVQAGAVNQTSSLALVTTGGLLGRLEVSGGTFTSSNTLTVNGPTAVTAGTLNFNLSTNARIFVGNVSVTGGSWTNGGNRAVQFRGGITCNAPGTFNNGTNTTTFNTISPQVLGGDGAMTFGPVAVAAGVTINRTNTNTITITGALNGGNATTSIWNDDAGVLNYTNAASAAAPMATGVLNADNASNTVRYHRTAAGGAQDIEATTYRTLEIGDPGAGAGTGTKTALGNLTVNGDVTIAGAAVLSGGTNRTHSFNGNFYVNNPAAIPWTFTGSSTVNFNAPFAGPGGTTVGPSAGADASLTALAFNVVNINNTTGVTFNRDANASGNLTVGTDAILIPAADIIIGGAGTLTGPTAPNRGTVRVTRTAAAPDFLTQYTITNKTYTNLVVDYAATAAQTVNNVAYGHLKLSGSGVKTMPGAALATTGDFIMSGSAQATAASAMTVGGAFDMSAVGNTASFNGGSFTHAVAGNFTKAATSTFTPATSTFNFNGTALQTITGNVTFNHLTVSNSTVGNSVSIANDVTVNGNISHGGTPLAGAGKIVLSGGSAAHQLSGAGTYQNLQLNDVQGALLTASPTVSGTLTLTSGLFTTGALNTLIIGGGGSITGASATSHVVGNLAKTFNAAGAFSYAVGDGTRYTPVDITFTALPTTGRMTVSATAGDHPDTTAEISSIDPARSVNRYWTLKNATLVGTFNATFNYLAADLDGSTTAANMVIARGASCTGSGAGRSCSTTWSRPTLAGAPSTTQAGATGMDTGVTESDFAIGERAPVRFSREKEFIFTRELY